MTTQDPKNALPARADQQPAQDAVALSRRRFIRTGSTGAVLTLASGSGMATVCTVPSGAMNSRSPLDNTCAGGMSPGYWKNNQDVWPKTALSSPSTLFGKVFACSEPRASLTLAQAIAAEDVTRKMADPDNKCFHFTATYLNILAGYVTFLSTDKLKQMWNELEVFDAYVPAAGAQTWEVDEVLTYLDSTYHNPKG